MARLVAVIDVRLDELRAALDRIAELVASRDLPDWILEELHAMTGRDHGFRPYVDMHQEGFRLVARPSMRLDVLLACIREQPLLPGADTRRGR